LAILDTVLPVGESASVKKELDALTLTQKISSKELEGV
jgi:hypothetical protein